VPWGRPDEACRGDPGAWGRILVIPTELPFAKLVGAILYEAHAGSDMIADAHVVAACAAADNALVVTADPADISRLGGALRDVRVLTRAP
jgi:hypothetical protein